MKTGSKIAGLVAVAVMAMAFIGASSAIAGTTALCKADQNPCESKNLVTHVHETTLSGNKARLLASPEVKCDVLFLSTSVGGSGAPPVITGTFTYSNWEGSCTAEEENGPVELKVLRTAAELATVTSGTGGAAGLVHLLCFGFIDCYYVGSGLVGTGEGALHAGRTETNGGVKLSGQTVVEESGDFCPSSGKLDIVTTPLNATYVKAEIMVCVEGGLKNYTTNHSNFECLNPTGVGQGTFLLDWLWI